MLWPNDDTIDYIYDYVVLYALENVIYHHYS